MTSSTTILSIIESYPSGARFGQISKQVDEPPKDIMDTIYELVKQRKVIIEYNNTILYHAKEGESQ